MNLSKELDDLTYRIVGICMEVHREVGPGFPEEYYQRALEYAFTDCKISFESQKGVQMLYKGRKIGMNFLDFDIDRTLILEIKSVEELNNVHLFQTLKYIGVLRRPAALLVNFGQASLEHERVLPTLKMQKFWENNHQLKFPK